MKTKNPFRSAAKKAIKQEHQRLVLLWHEFWAAMDTLPRDQTKINRLREQMPEGDLAWPFWESLGCRRPF